MKVTEVTLVENGGDQIYDSVLAGDFSPICGIICSKSILFPCNRVFAMTSVKHYSFGIYSLYSQIPAPYGMLKD